MFCWTSGLVSGIPAVRISITLPGSWDTLAVAALELVRATGCPRTFFLVAVITTVIILITFVGYGDTVAVVTLELVRVVGTVHGAVGLVKSVIAVVLSITVPAGLDTSLRT